MDRVISLAIEELQVKDFGNAGVDGISNICCRYIFNKVKERLGSYDVKSYLGSAYHANFNMDDIADGEQEWYIESALLTTCFVKPLKIYRKNLKRSLVENLLTQYGALFAHENYGVSINYLKREFDVHIDDSEKDLKIRKTKKMRDVSERLIVRFRSELSEIKLGSDMVSESKRLSLYIAMAETYGNLTKASEILGISRESARSGLGVSVSQWREEYLDEKI